MLWNRLADNRSLVLPFLATITALALVLQPPFLPPAALAQTVAEEALDQTPVEMTGILTILYEDWPAGGRQVHLLESEGHRYSLHFTTRAPAHLRTGDRIRVRGVRVHDAAGLGSPSTSDSVYGTLALSSDSTSVQTVIAAPVPNTIGEQKTLVILVDFQDNPIQPYTPALAQSVVFGTTSSFFLENSYQQTWLSGDVVGWYTIPIDSTGCDEGTIGDYARQAASAAGVDVTAYAHHLYAFPQNNACGWWGRSTVGGTPSQSWVNGSLELGVAAHELGHGLDLWHSHSLDCGATAVIGPSCATVEYGDILDMMGASHSADFNAFQKERLGWLNSGASPPITTVLTGGTYTLETYEAAGAGPKALKILKSTDPSTGSRTWYYVESRQPIGFDGFLDVTSTNVLNGILVRTGSESSGNSSDLLDMTPGTPVYYWWYDPALVAGQSFSDPDTGVTITADWVTGIGAGITVRFQTAVTVSTDRPSYTRNQTVFVTATVSSGGMPVSSANLLFTITKPNGAVVTGKATTGTNGAAVYKLRLKQGDPVGVYQGQVSATSGGSSGTAATSFTVQ